MRWATVRKIFRRLCWSRRPICWTERRANSLLTDSVAGNFHQRIPSAIRINQNPFSPEYDKLGFGRIEILTKPGSEGCGGSAYYNFANQFWNSRNPYAAQKAPFMLHEYGGNLTGPINKTVVILSRRAA